MANGITQDAKKAFYIICATGPGMLRLPITADTLSSTPFPTLNICENSNKGLFGEAKDVADFPTQMQNLNTCETIFQNITVHTDTQVHRQTETHTNMHTHTHTERERDTHTPVYFKLTEIICLLVPGHQFL